MALQSIPGGLWIPDPLIAAVQAPQLTTLATLTASGHIAGMIFQAPKAGAIRTVQFRTGAVSMNAASRLNARIQTVSATNGDPTGTDYGGSAVGTMGAAASANAWTTITLGTDATVVNVGDVICCVVGYGTFTAADSVVIQATNSSNSIKGQFPYSDVFTASWAKNVNVQGGFGIGYSDGTFAYIPLTYPVTAYTNQSYASNTAVTDEYALSFQVPFACELSAVSAIVTTSGDYEVILYTGTSATETLTIDKDQSASANIDCRVFKFTTNRTLAINTVYRIGIRPTTTTAITLLNFTVSSAAILDQMAGGQNFRLGTRIDQGAWDSDTTTKRPFIFLQFSKLDDGVSSGGVKTHRGMTGGCNA